MRRLAVIIVGDKPKKEEVEASARVPQDELIATFGLAPKLMLGARYFMALPMLANYLALRVGAQPVGPDLQMSPETLGRSIVELITARRFITPSTQTGATQGGPG